MKLHHRQNIRKRQIPLFAAMITLLCLLAACAHNGVERIEQPADDLQIDFVRGSAAVIRNPYAIFSIRNISESEWRKILADKHLPFSQKSDAAFRVPKLLFFVVTITNIGSNPVFLTGADIIYNEQKYPSLTFDDLTLRFSSPAYQIFNFKEISSYRRLIYSGTYLNSEFLEDSINYKLDFILPNDTVVAVMPFEYPPASLTRYKLEFSFSSGRIRRRLSFNIDRNEYRTNGKDFRRTRDTGEIFLR